MSTIGFEIGAASVAEIVGAYRALGSMLGDPSATSASRAAMVWQVERIGRALMADICTACSRCAAPVAPGDPCVDCGDDLLYCRGCGPTVADEARLFARMDVPDHTVVGEDGETKAECLAHLAGLDQESKRLTIWEGRG